MEQQITTECGYTQQDIESIKGVMGFRCSDADLKVFLHICQRSKLDPLARQIYAIPRGGRMTIQTSIDGFRLIAERTGKYSPGKPTQYEWDDKGKLISATSYVKKLAGGEWHEVGETAYLAEFIGTSPFWRKMPSVMLAKVAESRALRRAFPNDLSGIYTDDEMDNAVSEPAQHKQLPKQDTKEKVICDKTYKALDEFVNGHEELRAKLLDLCGVSSFRDIKEHQVDAVRKFTANYLNRKEANNENT